MKPLNQSIKRPLCNCNVLFPPGYKNSRLRSTGHNAVLFGGHAPWGERLLLDQIAVGTPRAMDVYSSLAEALPGQFAAAQAKGKRTLEKLGFVTETLLGVHVAKEKAWLAVRPVT